MGLFDWIDRTPACSFLQLAFCDTVGVDLHFECACERGVDGGDVALFLAARWLSLAMDSQLGRAHCHQHVALSLFGVVILARQHRIFSSGTANPAYFGNSISRKSKPDLTMSKRGISVIIFVPRSPLSRRQWSRSVDNESKSSVTNDAGSTAGVLVRLVGSRCRYPTQAL